MVDVRTGGRKRLRLVSNAREAGRSLVVMSPLMVRGEVMGMEMVDGGVAKRSQPRSIKPLHVLHHHYTAIPMNLRSHCAASVIDSHRNPARDSRKVHLAVELLSKWPTRSRISMWPKPTCTPIDSVFRLFRYRIRIEACDAVRSPAESTILPSWCMMIIVSTGGRLSSW